MPNKTKLGRRALLATAMSAALAISGVGLTSAAQANTVMPAKPKTPTSSVPDTLALAGSLSQQTIAWGDCMFDPTLPEDVAAELLATPGLECADIVVPMDWKNPQNGKTFTLKVSRVTNLAQTDPNYKGTILMNPGGPGGAALHWGANILRRAPELKTNFNTIGIDPRGVGQSEQPICAVPYDDFKAGGKIRAKAVGETCSQIEAVTKITTEQTVYDFDFVRALLGVPKITYIGYSYGTWLGTWYGTIFGPNIERMLLDSAVNGTDLTMENSWNTQPVARDRQFVDAMIPYAARAIKFEQTDQVDPNDPVFLLPTDPATVEEWYFSGVERAEADAPGTAYFIWALMGGLGAFPDPASYPFASAAIRIFLEFELQHRISTGEIVIPDATAALVDTTVSDITLAPTASDKAAIAFASLESHLTVEQQADLSVQLSTIDASIIAAENDEPSADFVQGYDPFDAIRCGDGQWTQGEQYWDAWAEGIKTNTPFSGMLADQLYPSCAFWPTTNPSKPQPNKKTFPATFVIQGEEDSQTAYEGGLATGTQLPNTSFLAIDNATRHGYFPYRTACADDPAFAFLLTGATPKKTVICQGKPLPGDAVTYEMWSPINVNGKHVPGNGKIPSRVQDPQTGIAEIATVSSEIAAAETSRSILEAFRLAEVK